MKSILGHWACVVLLLYALVTVVATLPLMVTAFLGWSDVDEFYLVYAHWWYWLFVAVLLLCQAALLVVPVRVSQRRPVTRRALFWPIVVMGLFAGALVLGGLFSLFEFIDHEALDETHMAVALSAALCTWLLWSVIFLTRRSLFYGPTLLQRQRRYLIQGSILELLIAVPTHIVARHRNYCCAGFMTFVGLAMGLIVLLYAYGPVVYILYRERWRRLHPAEADREPPGALTRDERQVGGAEASFDE